MQGWVRHPDLVQRNRKGSRRTLPYRARSMNRAMFYLLALLFKSGNVDEGAKQFFAETAIVDYSTGQQLYVIPSQRV